MTLSTDERVAPLLRQLYRAVKLLDLRLDRVSAVVHAEREHRRLFDELGLVDPDDEDESMSVDLGLAPDSMANDPEEVIDWMTQTLAQWYRLHPMSDDEAAILVDLAETADQLVREHDRRQADEDEL